MRGGRHACALRRSQGRSQHLVVWRGSALWKPCSEAGRPTLEGARDAVDDARTATRGTKPSVVVRDQVGLAALRDVRTW